MTHDYLIEGMTCDQCVARVKTELLKLGDVLSADVQLQVSQAKISMQRHITLSTLQTAVANAGPYTITEAEHGSDMMHQDHTATGTGSYLPVYLIGAYLTVATLLLELINGEVDLMRWMQHFMSGFFLVFSFFKFLDLKGFAESYASYDIISKRWFGWGYVYPFIELALGLLYLTGAFPLLTNGATFVVMSISIIGVLQSVLQKRKIRCACLGVVFNIPMQSITIIEDAMMIAMSAVMLFTFLA